MNKEIYNEAEIELINLENADVLTTSVKDGSDTEEDEI